MKRPPGRPPLDDDARVTQAIRVRVTPAQRLELRRVADDNDTNMSGVIREAVDEYCGDYGERPIFRGTRRKSRRTL